MEIKDGSTVRHNDTGMKGRVSGKTQENGSFKQIVTWTNGRISYIKPENLTVLAA